MVHLTPGAVYKPRFGPHGACLAPVVLSFKLVEHRGEDWHELTHQIIRPP